MADYNQQEKELQTHYRTLSSADLIKEFHSIRQNQTPENMLNGLIKMTALLAVMDERNIPVPGGAQRPATQSAPQTSTTGYQSNDASSGANVGRIILGAVIMLVGIGLTAASEGGTIYYGAIIVGLIMLIGGFFGSQNR